MEMTYDQQKLVLLSHNHPFIRLHAEHVYSNYDHIDAGAKKSWFDGSKD